MPRRRFFSHTVSGISIALLAAADPADPLGQVIADLQPDGGGSSPPEWVRLLAVGENKARDGRGPFTVSDPDAVVARTLEYKGSIDLVLDFEHQTDLSKKNGQRADAAGWITDVAAKGPDGTPGIWVQVKWLPETVNLIRAKKYRYLSAVVVHDANNVVQFVPRASLTNTPALDSSTALFHSQHQVVPLSVHQKTVDLLAELTAKAKIDKVTEAMRAGKLQPALRKWAESLSDEQLTTYLAAAPQIITPGENQSFARRTMSDVDARTLTVETLSSEHKAQAAKFGVSLESYCEALNSQSQED